MFILKTKTRIFLILWIASIVSSVLVLPYISTIQAELLKKAGISFSFLVFIAIIQGGIAFGIASSLGLLLAEKTGFQLPLLSSWVENKKINFKGTFWLSVILGLISGISIFVVDKFIFSQSLLSSIKVQLWQGFLACFYGGIAEEVFMRLLLVSLFVFILVKIFGRKENNSVIAWMAIILVSVLFGIGHLPIASAVVKITPMVVLRVIVLNGIGGVIFGWLYWKKGLESAIISHFSADIVLQIIVPVLLS